MVVRQPFCKDNTSVSPEGSVLPFSPALFACVTLTSLVKVIQTLNMKQHELKA